jgi:NADH-quinone oxidoreductase subunit H
VVVVVLTSGELRLEDIVAQQGSAAGGAWNVLLHPIACIVMIITAIAESNRAPFDLAECEQELVGGYHTEYSALKFGMFFLAEYAHMITASGFIACLYFGGCELFPFSWKLGWGWLAWLNTSEHWAAGACRAGVLIGKIVFFIFLYMWIRWTLPRFRFDQLMAVAWKGLVPLASAAVVLAVVLVYFGREVSIWAPVGNAALIILMFIWTACARTPVSGRQSNLPPLPANNGGVG